MKKKQIIQSPRYYFTKTLSKSLIWEIEDSGNFGVDIALKMDEGKIVFTASGRYWGWWGQCLDFMNDYLKGDEVWDRVYRLWKAHHLNDMHAGTERQEEFIEMGIRSGDLLSHNYDEVKEFLIKWGMYEDDWYEYWSQWLYRPIPADDLWEIFTLLKS